VVGLLACAIMPHEVETKACQISFHNTCLIRHRTRNAHDFAQ
jgi:hypothetical protein